MVKGLTPKQEAFVLEVIRTGNQRQSYRKAYPNTRMSDSSVDTEASEMLNGTGKFAKNPKVSRRYHELLEEAKKEKEKQQREAILTRLDREEFLSSVVTNPEVSMSDRIRALDILNKMDGDYTTKIEAEVSRSGKLNDIISQIGGEGLEE